MKKHVRLQGRRFSFRLRVFDTPVDAGESFDTEEDAAFAADLSKHYLRIAYHVELDPSLEPDLFAALSHRRNIALSNCLDALPPGVRTFLVLNEEKLNAHRARSTGNVPEWATLRDYDNEAVRKWARDCEAASVKWAALQSINHEYLNTLLASVSARLNEALAPLARAVSMHNRVEFDGLAERLQRLNDLRRDIDAVIHSADAVQEDVCTEQARVASDLRRLEDSRPPLI